MEFLQHQQLKLSFKNKGVEFMFAYQQKNVSKMLPFCDAGGTVEFISLRAAGKGRIGEPCKNIQTTPIDCFANIDNTLDAAVAEDTNTVRSPVVICGTQAKDVAGIPNTGKSFDRNHILFSISTRQPY